jgi:acetylornithine/succinyldiaminopimelate/putrescine aminotransferase
MMERKQAISDYRQYVSAAKVEFYKKYRMLLVPGTRQGGTISDLSGKAYLNFHCNGGVFNLGHRNPEIIDAVRKASADHDIGYCDVVSEPKLQLARKLAELAPGSLDRVALSTSGSEAIELSIKVAKTITGKPGVVSAAGGYHGGTGFAIAAGDAPFREPFGPRPEQFVQVPFGNLEALKNAVGDKTAAVLLETIPATLGMALPPDDYFAGVRKLCDEHNVVLIIDEVQTGLGRTGKLWGINHWDVQPDIMVVGKGLSGGIYPIAATCMTAKMAAAFDINPLLHQTDFGGADLGCIAALKVLEISSSDSFLAHVNQMSEIFGRELNRIAKKYPQRIAEIRQKGLFIGIRFVDEVAASLAVKLLFDNGIYAIYAGNEKSVLQFLPPLIITEKEAERALALFEKTIRKFSSIKGRVIHLLVRWLNKDPV